MLKRTLAKTKATRSVPRELKSGEMSAVTGGATLAVRSTVSCGNPPVEDSAKWDPVGG
ncbi:MAG: hypothetical protein AAFR92_04200 [Pseudomonadota bacterium]